MRQKTGFSSSARALWALGLAMFMVRVGLALRQSGGDFALVWVAVDAFLRHQSPYEAWRVSLQVSPFFYPPSALLLLSPFGMLSLARALPLFVVLDAVAILWAGFLCLSLVGLPVASRRAALMPAALALFSPITQTLYDANVNGLVLAGEVAALLAATRGRWLLAGGLLGATFAVKPVLLPLVLLLVLSRRWASAAIAVALPAALSIAALPLIVKPDLYFTWVVPQIIGSEAIDQNVALRGVGLLFGLPLPLVTALRAAVLILACVIVWRLARAPDGEPRRLIHLSAVILVATFLGNSYSWGYYGVYLLPLLMSAIAGGPFSGWLGLAAFYCLGGPDVKLWLLAGGRGLMLWQLRVALGLVLILAGLARLAAGTRPLTGRGAR